jgi:hypothetical protein
MLGGTSSALRAIAAVVVLVAMRAAAVNYLGRNNYLSEGSEHWTEDWLIHYFSRRLTESDRDIVDGKTSKGPALQRRFRWARAGWPSSCRPRGTGSPSNLTNSFLMPVSYSEVHSIADSKHLGYSPPYRPRGLNSRSWARATDTERQGRGTKKREPLMAAPAGEWFAKTPEGFFSGPWA